MDVLITREKNFWLKGDSIIELKLEDLFVKESAYCQFLLNYCENYFKTTGYGYYSSRPELLPVLSSNDLNTFILTDKGLMIIFRAYTVGGWADGPDTVIVLYPGLQNFICPKGPLKDFLFQNEL